MKCGKCGSKNVYEIITKTNDESIRVYKGKKQYITNDIENIINGEYIEFNVCLDCGHIQGKWPVKFGLESIEEKNEIKKDKTCCVCKKKLPKKSEVNFCKTCIEELELQTKNYPIDYQNI